MYRRALGQPGGAQQGARAGLCGERRLGGSGPGHHVPGLPHVLSWACPRLLWLPGALSVWHVRKYTVLRYVLAMVYTFCACTSSSELATQRLRWDGVAGWFEVTGSTGGLCSDLCCQAGPPAHGLLKALEFSVPLGMAGSQHCSQLLRAVWAVMWRSPAQWLMGTNLIFYLGHKRQSCSPVLLFCSRQSFHLLIYGMQRTLKH